MKKLILLPVLFLLTLSMVLAASVSRNMPDRVDPGAEVEVTLTLNEAPVGEAVIIADSIPNTITVKSWEVLGSEEAKADVSYQQKASQKEGFQRHSWEFTTASGAPSVIYKFDAPVVVGSYVFETRWITSEGFSKDSTTLIVRTISCGDGVCEGNENSDTCEADCPKPVPPAPTPTPAPTEEPKVEEPAGKVPVAWIIAAVVVILGIILIVVYQKKKQQF